MNKHSLTIIRTVLATVDIVTLNIAYSLSWLFFDQNIPNEYNSDYLEFFFALNIAWVLLGSVTKIYRKTTLLSFEYTLRNTAFTYLVWFATLNTYLLFFRETHLSRLFIGSTITLFAVGLVINRFAYLIMKKTQGKWFNQEGQILIIGYNDTSKKLIQYLEQDSINAEILGFTENPERVNELSHYPIIGDISSTIELSKQNNVDRIYSTITPEQEPLLYNLMREAENECIRFKIVPDLSMFVKGRFHVSYYNDIPILTMRGESLDQLNNRIKKRILDIAVSLTAIVFILSWLLPLISILILLESRGPIFFSQLRTGKNGKMFRCLKFRSMRVNKDSDSKQATKNDSRVTRIGRFLRRSSLDEFPQFFNVFVGDMSIVGPRPHMLQHTNDYSKIVDQYMVRHFLKPGITGWAQVNGYRGEITEPVHIRNRVEYDIWYMENWSLILDLKIIFLTFYNIIRGEEKAY
ncbi:putative colanic acid biosysnthesis UDP-glucose lipid carrier transferase [Cnuella takakiae]|uniref:Putative colanic acid biosysnthesis UDP-glucose lipid carrier transferase n=1 Tax=Cnuella takakiae TaxID=1302690 RepID=A0A1M4YF44_9BACT|nr:undecaprenyl-phosphate glucose phosphotransferase [Cnuella takakiae]OLY93134.1 undecaprenyl-phosphate glucose phosphotransferase [Cnuella takakiae]SHF04404.1 putative colanic acid biosysnthesis UDP-glucose lipid carrier transferase [Cnuella takakiae]